MWIVIFKNINSDELVVLLLKKKPTQKEIKKIREKYNYSWEWEAKISKIGFNELTKINGDFINGEKWLCSSLYS
jgi:hypothetical protein